MSEIRSAVFSFSCRTITQHDKTEVFKPIKGAVDLKGNRISAYKKSSGMHNYLAVQKEDETILSNKDIADHLKVGLEVRFSMVELKSDRLVIYCNWPYECYSVCDHIAEIEQYLS